jgi:hypothetical protein
LRQKNPEEKTPMMEKNEMPILGASDVAASTSAAGASATTPVQDPVAASNIAAGASAAGASAAAPVQAPVATSDVAIGSSAAGALATAAVQALVQAPVQFPVDWDPYEQEPYVAPENPYDTSIIDDEEVTLCSLILIPFQSFLCLILRY